MKKQIPSFFKKLFRNRQVLVGIMMMFFVFGGDELNEDVIINEALAVSSVEAESGESFAEFIVKALAEGGEALEGLAEYMVKVISEGGSALGNVAEFVVKVLAKGGEGLGDFADFTMKLLTEGKKIYKGFADFGLKILTTGVKEEPCQSIEIEPEEGICRLEGECTGKILPERHYIEVTKIEENQVTFVVASGTPHKFILKEGETERIDLDGDNAHDIAVTLDKIDMDKPATADYTLEVIAVTKADLEVFKDKSFGEFEGKLMPYYNDYKKKFPKLSPAQLDRSKDGDGYTGDEEVIAEVKKFQNWYNRLFKNKKCLIRGRYKDREYPLYYQYVVDEEPFKLDPSRAIPSRLEEDGKHGPNTEIARQAVKNKWIVCPDDEVKKFQDWYNEKCEVMPMFREKMLNSFVEEGQENEISIPDPKRGSKLPAEGNELYGILESNTDVAMKAVDQGFVGCPPECDIRDDKPPVFHGGLLPGPYRAEDGVCYVSNRLMPAVTNTMLAYLLGVAVIMVMIGGVMYLVSSGTPEMIQKGRDIIAWAVIGAVIAILAYTLVKFVTRIDFLGEAPPLTVAEEPEKIEIKKREPAVIEKPECVEFPEALKKIPPSCYEGDIQGTQTQKGACDIYEGLKKVCADLGLLSCSVQAVQRKLVATGSYKDPKTGKALPANCTQIDGKYGQCTQKALEYYYENNGCDLNRLSVIFTSKKVKKHLTPDFLLFSRISKPRWLV